MFILFILSYYSAIIDFIIQLICAKVSIIIIAYFKNFHFYNFINLKDFNYIMIINPHCRA